MTFGTDIRKSKYGLNNMELNEVRVFPTPDSYSKSLIRRIIDWIIARLAEGNKDCDQ